MSLEEKKISCHLTQGEADSFIKNLPVEEEIQDLSEFFKVFGEPTRLKILFLLKEKEFCVHDLTVMLDMNQTAVSHQLKYLRQVRLVKYRKDGKNVFYSLNDEHITGILATGLDHIGE
ncbi:MAG: metalloregulator ArsR/SmtB family transcription factor [Spirochaetales bacterium]|nr:metalloregulator ArsR/SmtB family transcription factor [Spirochaetales bacterium]